MIFCVNRFESVKKCFISRFAPRLLQSRTVAFTADVRTWSTFHVQNDLNEPNMIVRLVTLQRRYLSDQVNDVLSSKRRGLVARKEPINVTDKGRKFFLTALESTSRSDVVGIILRYQQHSSGDPRMVFSFDFVSENELHKLDEPCRLSDDYNLYVHHNAFMKVLGGTVDFSSDIGLPIVLDREGNELDPNF